MSDFWGIGATMGAGLQYLGQQQANDANRDIANAQMAFQREEAERSQAFNHMMVNQAQDYTTTNLNRQEDFARWGIGNQQDFQTRSTNSAQDFAREMSNTSWQRGVADMKAAGINPILAYSKGGASAPTVGAPSGASGSISAPGGSTASRPAMSGASANMVNPMSGVVANAVQAMQALEATRKLSNEADLVAAETQLTHNRAYNVSANTAVQVEDATNRGFDRRRIKASALSEEERPGQIRGSASQSRASAASLEQDARQRRQLADDYENWGPASTLRDVAVQGERLSHRTGATGAVQAAGRSIYRDLPPAVRSFIDSLRQAVQ